MPDTRPLALSGLNTASGRGLEIGPLNSPLLPRAPGRIFSADHCSTEELMAKYAKDPAVPTNNIRKVDFDLSRMDLSETNVDGGFDYVVASHVIEHVPDIVGWLRETHSILNDGGVLALVVPDKRFTFDVFRRESTFWMVRDAVGLSRPSIDVIIDHFMNVVDVDAVSLWADSESRHDLRRSISPEVCPDLVERHRQGEYIDAHCWVFTPSSFISLLGEIVEHYDLGYELAYFETTLMGQWEFYVQLRKSSVKTNWTEQVEQVKRYEISNSEVSTTGALKLGWKMIILKLMRIRRRLTS